MAVLNMLDPELNFGFAWDTESKRVYIIHGNGRSHEQIANDVMSPELAQKLASMWCAGYRSRMREDGRIPGNKHYHMLAEMGAVGAKWENGG